MRRAKPVFTSYYASVSALVLHRFATSRLCRKQSCTLCNRRARNIGAAYNIGWLRAKHTIQTTSIDVYATGLGV
jgi:hypothetical protein